MINISIQAFVEESFGEPAWQQVVEGAGVETKWVSSCPYNDADTYALVVNAARLLGITVDEALQAFGGYFVQYLQRAGYGKLLQCLGELPRAPVSRPRPRQQAPSNAHRCVVQLSSASAHRRRQPGRVPQQPQQPAPAPLRQLLRRQDALL
jgi:hypothetical protein